VSVSANVNKKLSTHATNKQTKRFLGVSWRKSAKVGGVNQKSANENKAITSTKVYIIIIIIMA